MNKNFNNEFIKKLFKELIFKYFKKLGKLYI
jgi:hypothetical protein